MSVIKSILLFPVGLVQGMFWLLWSLWFDDQSMGIAPPFCDDGNAIVYIKKKTGKMQVIHLSLSSKKELCLFETSLPIQQLVLNGNSVICSSFSRRGNLLVKITMDGEVVSYDLAADSRDYILTASPVSLVEVSTLCVNNTCKFTLHQKSQSGVQQLGLSANKVRSFCVLADSRCLAYSTAGSTHILTIDNDVTLDYQDIVFMRGNASSFLAYCKETRQFIIIKGVGISSCKVSLPEAFWGRYVLSASLSPDGRSIAFFAFDTPGEGELVVLSVDGDDYYAIGKRARIYDIHWAPSGKQISTSGVLKRDFFEISYSYKMRNCAVNDKEVIDLTGNIFWQS